MQLPNIGSMHPYVVHIVIGLTIAGCVLRIISLTGKWSWMNQAAATALILGAIASVVGVKSGLDAHGPAERVPGARPAVVEHEEWGERTRNLFLVIAAIEVAALAIPSRRRWFYFASGALGVAGLAAIYETAEHGGHLVYSYAGGVGLRTGDPEDVGNLLRAGLYHQAMLDRREHRPESAARLFAEMKQRWPSNEEVQALAADSRLRDAHDAAGALADVDAHAALDPGSTDQAHGDAHSRIRLPGTGPEGQRAGGGRSARRREPRERALSSVGRFHQVSEGTTLACRAVWRQVRVRPAKAVSQRTHTDHPAYPIALIEKRLCV
jgi:uncharacterized membrane protein